MDSIQRGVITLIKSAVLQKWFPLPEGFSLKEAYPVIVSHHVIPLAFEGAVLCGIPMSDPTMSKLFLGYCKAIQYNEGQQTTLAKLEKLFQENAVDYLPLKGCLMKGMYPKPELRTMGDADILIRESQYEKIVPLVKQLGFSFDHESSVHANWVSDKLMLELHKRLFSDRYPTLERYFTDAWQLAVPEKGFRYAMSQEDTFLFLFMHFTKHYMWSGIGCRHVTDLWVYLRKHPQPGELLEKLQCLGLREFYDNILDLIAFWFEDGQSSDKLEYMTQFLFSMGSWGTQQDAIASEALFRAKNGGKDAKIAFWMKRIFPSVEMLKYTYPVLKKMPWMLPVIWVVRAVNVVLIKRDFRKKMKIFDQSVTRESVERRRRSMQYVGLEDVL